MWFLLIVPMFFVLANAWLAFSSRTRRAPEIAETIAAHERFRQALSSGNVHTVRMPERERISA